MAPLRLAAKPFALVFALALALALASGPAALGAELYGRPLRGLTAVPATEVAKNPGRYAGRSVRVEGTLRKGGEGAFSLTQGDGVLRLEAEGFSLPARADGAPAAAEGRVVAEGGSATLVATGVEIRR